MKGILKWISLILSSRDPPEIQILLRERERILASTDDYGNYFETFYLKEGIFPDGAVGASCKAALVKRAKMEELRRIDLHILHLRTGT